MGKAYGKDFWGRDGKVGKDSVDGEGEEESDRKECGVHLEIHKIRWETRGL